MQVRESSCFEWESCVRVGFTCVQSIGMERMQFLVVFGYVNVKLWCIEGEFDREKIYQVGWTVVIYEWLRYSR